MVREGKVKDFFYLDNRTFDGKYNIIVIPHVVTSNVHNNIPYSNNLDATSERFNFSPATARLDTGCNTPYIRKGLVERNIYGAIGSRGSNHVKGMFYKRDFTY